MGEVRGKNENRSCYGRVWEGTLVNTGEHYRLAPMNKGSEVRTEIDFALVGCF